MIATRNSASTLRQCLLAIRAQTDHSHDIEVIVVDDASSGVAHDDASSGVAHEDASGGVAVGCSATREIACELADRLLVLETQRGPAFARNRGAELSRGEIIAFIDADVVLDPQALRLAISELSDPSVQAVFGSYDDAPADRHWVSQYRNLLHHYVHQHSAREATTFWAGCGWIRRAEFVALGGFNESYTRPSIEDIELGYRLRARGGRIRLVPEMQGKHLKRWTLTSFAYTDLFRRALPWARLLRDEPARVRNDLNLSWRNRVSVALAGATSLAIVIIGIAAPLSAAGGSPVIAIASAMIITGMVGIAVANADFFRFLRRRLGGGRAIGSVLLHFVHLICAGLGFAVAMLSPGPTAQGACSR